VRILENEDFKNFPLKQKYWVSVYRKMMLFEYLINSIFIAYEKIFVSKKAAKADGLRLKEFSFRH